MCCKVCIREPEPNHVYCPRCWNLVKNKPDHEEHAASLKMAYDLVLDLFICFYTGLPLNDTNPHDPWYVTFDHLIPGKKGTMAVCAWWVNDSKGDMTAPEYRRAVSFVAAFYRGESPDWSKLRFSFWNRRPQPMMALPPPDDGLAKTPAMCDICGRRPKPGCLDCPRCRAFIFQGRDIVERRAAMKDGWDPKIRRFRDKYSGRPLNHWNPESPNFMVFDHPDPDGDRLVLTFAWLNMMKSDLDTEEFPKAMLELDKHFNGAPFDKDAVKFSHWYRAPRPTQ
jgi:hypothetical protein